MDNIDIARKKMEAARENRIDNLSEYEAARDNYYKLLAEEKRKKAVLSEKKRENLANAFSEIDWDFENAECLDAGRFLDRPQFHIWGKNESFPNIMFRYNTGHPGGGSTSLILFEKRMKSGKERLVRILSFCPASQHKAKEIWAEIVELIG